MESSTFVTEIFIILDQSESERTLSSIVKVYPYMIVADYTVVDAVNGKHSTDFY